MRVIIREFHSRGILLLSIFSIFYITGCFSIYLPAHLVAKCSIARVELTFCSAENAVCEAFTSRNDLGQGQAHRAA